MNVLIACEEIQAVCKAFREKGHNAFSADIQECSGGHPEWHILGDVLKILNPWEDDHCEEDLRTFRRYHHYVGISFMTCDGKSHCFEGKWDLIIAHPPCTYLTNAGARWLWAGHNLNKERYQKGLEAKDFFLKFWNADCKRIAIENPVPSAIYELPQYSQIIQPYQFGHTATKKTCLWLKGLKNLTPTDIVEPYKGRRFQQKNGKWRSSCWEMDQKGGLNRAKERSKTFQGMAKAMAEQWGDAL